MGPKSRDLDWREANKEHCPMRGDIVLFGMRHLGHETNFLADNSSQQISSQQISSQQISSQQIGLPSRDREFRQSNSFLGELGVHSNEW